MVVVDLLGAAGLDSNGCVLVGAMMGDLSPHFSSEEFKCKCGRLDCEAKLMRVSETLLARLEVSRAKAQIPFIIVSGIRCRFWNTHEGGERASAHLTGEAADIYCRDSLWRFKMVEAFYAAGFKRIGEEKTFIHVDVSETLPCPRKWLY